MSLKQKSEPHAAPGGAGSGRGLEEAGVAVPALEEAGIWMQGHSWSQRTFRQRGRGRAAASQVLLPQLPRLHQTTAGLQLPLWQRPPGAERRSGGMVRRVAGDSRAGPESQGQHTQPSHTWTSSGAALSLFPSSSNTTLPALEGPWVSRRQAAGPSPVHTRPTSDHTQADAWSGFPCWIETQSQWQVPQGTGLWSRCHLSPGVLVLGPACCGPVSPSDAEETREAPRQDATRLEATLQ